MPSIPDKDPALALPAAGALRSCRNKAEVHALIRREGREAVDLQWKALDLVDRGALHIVRMFDGVIAPDFDDTLFPASPDDE